MIPQKRNVSQKEKRNNHMETILYYIPLVLLFVKLLFWRSSIPFKSSNLHEPAKFWGITGSLGKVLQGKSSRELHAASYRQSEDIGRQKHMDENTRQLRQAIERSIDRQIVVMYRLNNRRIEPSIPHSNTRNTPVEITTLSRFVVVSPYLKNGRKQIGVVDMIIHWYGQQQEVLYRFYKPYDLMVLT